jgi:hypothetical protein
MAGAADALLMLANGEKPLTAASRPEPVTRANLPRVLRMHVERSEPQV